MLWSPASSWCHFLCMQIKSLAETQRSGAYLSDGGKIMLLFHKLPMFWATIHDYKVHVARQTQTLMRPYSHTLEMVCEWSQLACKPVSYWIRTVLGSVHLLWCTVSARIALLHCSWNRQSGTGCSWDGLYPYAKAARISRDLASPKKRTPAHARIPGRQGLCRFVFKVQIGWKQSVYQAPNEWMSE